MTFVRTVFGFALIMLIAGVVGSRAIVNHLFGDSRQPTIRIAAASIRKTATSIPKSHHAVAVHATAAPHATAVPTAVRTATARPTATPKPTGTPTPTPTTGTVSLAQYWVGSQAARRGQVVAIGYVINNGTGHPERIFLGASVKSSRAASWSYGATNDPTHDVVAVVPPGISTHVRYFALSGRLHPGAYDVAWGLRNAANGERTALVTAAAALRVVR